MGTDIHLYVERRHPNGSWVMLHPPECPPDKRDDDYPWWGPGFCASECYGDDDDCIGARCRVCGGTGRDPQWFHSRNYEVFAILTGQIRNYFDLKGVAPPRGFPTDVSADVQRAYSGDHTESWLLVSELLAFDWKQTATHHGIVSLFARNKDMTSYEDWRNITPRKRPESYCMGTSSPVLTIEQADKILAASDLIHDIQTAALTTTTRRWSAAIGGGRPQRYLPNDDVRWCVEVFWEERYEESAQEFLEFVRDYLVPLGPPSDVRIVFGFDS